MTDAVLFDARDDGIAIITINRPDTRNCLSREVREGLRAAWERFERLVANDLRLLAVEPIDFHRAALMTLDAASGIRAGDALHLACAERAGAKSLATLDAVMAGNASRVRLKPVPLSP